MIFVSADL